MKPRITVSVQPDGSFDIHVNEAGRELLVKELQHLSERWDHFHLDHWDDPEMADATEAPLSAIPYRPDDRVLLNGKVSFRPDHWDREYFPHVMSGDGEARS
ncbi:hypothetical protein [Phenylobacterium sp.]|uniref:hypothetical protein n=1 Tax=Phenylobacterium sp. TaxID=1871053 RepID=UPI00271F2DB5|nr:hypothetical protein [Phenylobacterium sp.]MDO8380975.1 hypothetical protein [Phenylobacterium sp.]